ncbi:MAG TPA: DUF2975 domain-containing protein [Rhizomicrobium sp.]|jgi:hypothetical protein
MTISRPLARASRVTAWFSGAAVVILPLGTTFMFLAPEWSRMLGFDMDRHGLAHLTAAVPLSDRALALACAMIPAAIATLGLVALTRLFLLFNRGEVFGHDALRALGQITAALFWNVLVAFLMEAPITYFLTRTHPPVQHGELQLSIGSDDVQILFLAGVAWVVSRVMAEARSVADENAGFV